MPKLLISWLVCWVICSLSVPHCGASTNAVKALRLDVTLSAQSSTNVELLVVLKNVGSNTVSVPFGSLPWALYAMTVVVVQDDPMLPPLKQMIVSADGLRTVPAVEIRPGESQSGPIYLSDDFPGLLDALKASDVLVFWSYSLPVSEGLKRRLSGSLVISKRDVATLNQERGGKAMRRSPVDPRNKRQGDE